ncbi:MAG TPA: hypothetical protein PK530_12665, partial [Anaerolineales bacterium]|nr:hypothetical protein [Anaerolineales bacterium]
MKNSRLFPLVFVIVLAFGFVYSTLVFAKNNETVPNGSPSQTQSQAPTQAAIDFRKTVGVDPGECASTQYIITYDGSVTYCYQVTNTGPITLTVHDLTDSELGSILSSFAYTLTPGASYYFTQTVVITQNTVNTATWTASNPDLAEIASDTDAATVYLLNVCPLGYLPRRYESASFSTFPPAGWDMTNTTTTCTGELGWTNSDPGNRTNLTGANGNFAIADAEACGIGSVMTTSMTTVPMNFTGLIDPQFFFFMDYKDSDPNQGNATVQVSTDGGANWATLFTWNEDVRGPQIIYSSMPGAGEENVQMRWNLSNANPDTWWEIDNATFVVCGPKSPDVILSPRQFSSIQPPDVQTDLTLELTNIGTETLNWSLDETGVSNVPSNHSPDAPGAIILYDQTGLAGTISIPSQEYPSAQAGSTNQAADDFVIPAADGAWAIYTLFAPGAYLTNAGQIPYVNIYFYADANGTPGQELLSYLQVEPQADTAGDLSIDLPAPAILPAGTYWVSIQAKTFSGNVQWGWTERTVQTNALSAWRNPGGGLSTPCTDWGTRAGTCGIGIQPDLLFQLRGLSSGCTPSNISWLSATPTSGSLTTNAGETVTITLDSTGLANGIYDANYCLTTNDPAEPFITLPVELTVVTQPELFFEKTVGTNPAECATT